MRECHDLNSAIGQRTVKDGVWKSRQPNSANTAGMDQLPSIGSCHRQADDPLEFVDERRAKAGALVFVKLNGLEVLSFRANDETVTHLIKARAFLATSSPEMV